MGTAGRAVFIKMTGTGGSEKSYEKLAQAGIGTVICMHSRQASPGGQDNHINVIISGHMII